MSFLVGVNMSKHKYHSIERIVNKLVGKFVFDWLPISGSLRYKLAKCAGFCVVGKNGYIGKGVSFDNIHPDLITIDEGAMITEGTIIYTHYLKPWNYAQKKGAWFRFGNVHICTNAFIGARTIICNDVTIGECAIVAAGSVVTKSIPPYELWGGGSRTIYKKN